MASTGQSGTAEAPNSSQDEPQTTIESGDDDTTGDAAKQELYFSQTAFKKLLAIQMYDEELVASAPSRKNWKGMFIAIMVILAIIGLIVAAVFYMREPDDGPRVKRARFSLEDVLGNRFQVQRFNGFWLQDNQLLMADSFNNPQVLNPDSGEIHALFTNMSIVIPPGAKFSMSSDRRYLLISTNKKKKPAQVEEFLISVYDLTSGVVSPIPLTAPDERVHVQAFQWSTRGSSLVYAHDNNLYLVTDLSTGRSEKLTQDGAFNTIFNGIPDWTYQSITKDQPAFWFSEDGEHLSFVSYNDTAVPEIDLSLYSEPDSFDLYSEKVVIRFPTPASPIPKANLRVIDLKEANPLAVKDLRPPLSLRDQEYYLTSVRWVTNQRICAVWSVRAQNLSLISFCDAGPWHCQTVHTIETGVEGWLNLETHLHFHSNGNTFVYLAPVKTDNEDYYNNIVMVDSVKRYSWPVTRHSFDVLEILGWDLKRNVVYYAGNAQNKPTERHVYQLKMNGPKNDEEASECLTCSLPAMPADDDDDDDELAPTKAADQSDTHQSMYERTAVITSAHPYSFHANSTCRYSVAVLSPNLDYYIHECRGPSIPYAAVRSLEDNRLVAVLPLGDAVREAAIHKAFPRIMQTSVPVLMDNTPFDRTRPDNVSVELYLPPGLCEEETTVYPLVVLATDEPGSRSITDEWKVNWATYMASARDIIVAKIDAHGSQGMGDTIRNSIYRKPGVLEAIDLIHVTKVLQRKFPYISPVKTALVGSHYGGFLSIYTLAKDTSNVFGCSVAISPIASWNVIAAPYAERYLGLLKEQHGQRSYFEADLTRYTKNLHKKHIYLVHGTLDEEVNVAHSFLVAKSMIKNKFSFHQQLFPDFDYPAMKRNNQMYESIDKFINDCYDRRTAPETDPMFHKGE